MQTLEDIVVEELAVSAEPYASACPPCGPPAASRRVALYNGHNLLAAQVVGSSETILACACCGAFGGSGKQRSRTKKLLEPCAGQAAAGMRGQRALFARRRFPQAGDPRRLEEPRPLDDGHRRFLQSLVARREAGPEHQEKSYQCMWSIELSRAEILLAYGLTEASVQELRADAGQERVRDAQGENDQIGY